MGKSKIYRKNNLKNIKIYVNANGYAAYECVDLKYLTKDLKLFYQISK